ncbi:hypothetical protein Acsp05_65180 [Actinokineospora sp. NBRC 105648]|nr:hypothetical protein Acsp05_65180 [Actinokineospora sp. NBRC 105648]
MERPPVMRVNVNGGRAAGSAVASQSDTAGVSPSGSIDDLRPRFPGRTLPSACLFWYRGEPENAKVDGPARAACRPEGRFPARTWLVRRRIAYAVAPVIPGITSLDGLHRAAPPAYGYRPPNRAGGRAGSVEPGHPRSVRRW